MADEFLSGFMAGQGDNGGNGNGGFWGDGLWAVIILAIIFGWGNGGFGYGGGGSGVQDGYVLASDMARIQSTISQGLCDGFYSTAQQINGVNMAAANNTAAIQQTLTQGFSGLNTEMLRNSYANQLATQGIQTQLASCCCELNTNIAQGNNATQVAIDKLGDRLEGRLRDMEFARLSEKLDEQRTANAVLQGQIDRAQLRTDIVNDVRPCPIPAYPACNPWAYQASSGCGCA